MKTFLGILCVTFAIQLVVVLGDAETHVPSRFKAGLEFHQDAGDKAATRSITSANQEKWTSSPVQTPINEETADLKAEKDAAEARDEGLEDLDSLGDTPLEDADQLATRGLDEEVDEFAADEDETEHGNLDTRGLLESGMNMVPSVESMRQTASNLRQTASRIPDAVAAAYQNPQAARDSLRSALSNAGSDMRNQMTNLYKSGLDKGIEAYKTLNKHLSPGLAKTLNHGVSSTIRGVQAAKESQIAKSISEKVGSWLP